MKHKFASFTWMALSGAALAITPLLAVMAAGEAKGQADAGAGQRLVADAARQVASEPAISAEIRYRIDAFGHELAGTGTYLQFGPGAEKLLRLDLRMQVGEKAASVQEIRGADTYWVRRDVPPGPPSLGRVDLKQLRKTLARPAAPAAGEVLPQGEWIMLGGLARLIAALEQNFRFAEPRADELQFSAEDGKSLIRLPIWVVEGQWKAERLAALVGREPGKLGPLPEQLPDRVELVLGRTEDALRLFPYRITYWHAKAADAKASKEAAAAAPRELLTLELFNVSRKPIDAREFEYQPGDQEVQNLTQFYVQRYSGELKLR